MGWRVSKISQTLRRLSAYAEKNISAFLEAFATHCGAGQVTTEMKRIDRVVQEIFLETELLFTATGRPAIGIADLLPGRKEQVGEVWFTLVRCVLSPQ